MMKTGSDSAKPSSTTSSFGRTARMVLLAVACSMLPGVPMAIVQFSDYSQQQQESREQAEQQIRELEQAAIEGEAGEATRMLFGVEEGREH